MGTLNNLDVLKRILLANFLKKRDPLSVTYITTYKCNFKCKYCDIWSYRDVRELTTNQALSMIDEFGRIGTKRFSFNGGEALLRPDLKKLIDKTKEYGMFSTLFTNGSLVKKRMEDIKNINVLVISLDGPKKIHDKHRQKGAYEKVIEAIKTAKEHDLNVWTNTVLTKYNLDYVDFILEKARELEFKTIFQPVLHYPHSANHGTIKRISPMIEKYGKAIEKLKQEKKKKKTPLNHSIKYLDYISKPYWEVNKRKCWAGKLYCAVTPDGMVAPCYPLFINKKWPNGLELGFKRAFDSIPEFNCNGCYCFTAETDFFYSLNPRVMYNMVKCILNAD